MIRRLFLTLLLAIPAAAQQESAVVSFSGPARVNTFETPGNIIY
jgi:hypothetical protein